MSKQINLLTIYNILNTSSELLSEDCVKKYLELEEIRPQELITIQRLCEYLKTDVTCHKFYENYYLNYKIPQIDKEFDLLRIGTRSIVNIELKSESVSEEKILKQLKRNHYYLSFLEKEVYCYTFMIAWEENILFYFNVVNDELKQITDIKHILLNLYDLYDIEHTVIDSLFTPVII